MDFEALLGFRFLVNTFSTFHQPLEEGVNSTSCQYIFCDHMERDSIVRVVSTTEVVWRFFFFVTDPKVVSFTQEPQAQVNPIPQPSGPFEELGAFKASRHGCN